MDAIFEVVDFAFEKFAGRGMMKGPGNGKARAAMRHEWAESLANASPERVREACLDWCSRSKYWPSLLDIEKIVLGSAIGSEEPPCVVQSPVFVIQERDGRRSLAMIAKHLLAEGREWIPVNSGCKVEDIFLRDGHAAAWRKIREINAFDAEATRENDLADTFDIFADEVAS